VIDIGTGAGIPGLILAIALPDIEFTLVDATGKKIAFLQSAIADLQLENASAQQARAEDLAREPDYREQFDAAIARSVGGLAELAELLLPFCKVGRSALAMKSLDVDSELKAAGFAARIMGAESANKHVVCAPGSAASDALIEWRKRAATPHKYPRRVGLPHNSPLLQSAGSAAGGRRR
jgi:16S rRNA (guanine527-N7)-methyltransferase